jgi:hypothetical protein
MVCLHVWSLKVTAFMSAVSDNDIVHTDRMRTYSIACDDGTNVGAGETDIMVAFSLNCNICIVEQTYWHSISIIACRYPDDLNVNLYDWSLVISHRFSASTRVWTAWETPRTRAIWPDTYHRTTTRRSDCCWCFAYLCPFRGLFSICQTIPAT